MKRGREHVCFNAGCAGYAGSVPEDGLCNILTTEHGAVRYDGDVVESFATRAREKEVVEAPSERLLSEVQACATAFTGGEEEDTGVPVYIIVGHSSYDSQFSTTEQEIKFSRDGTLFQVPEGCFYVSASPTGWGILTPNPALCTASSWNPNLGSFCSPCFL